MLNVDVGSAWKGEDTTMLVSSKLPENAEAMEEERRMRKVKTEVVVVMIVLSGSLGLD